MAGCKCGINLSYFIRLENMVFVSSGGFFYGVSSPNKTRREEQQHRVLPPWNHFFPSSIQDFLRTCNICFNQQTLSTDFPIFLRNSSLL